MSIVKPLLLVLNLAVVFFRSFVFLFYSIPFYLGSFVALVTGVCECLLKSMITFCFSRPKNVVCHNYSNVPPGNSSHER